MLSNELLQDSQTNKNDSFWGSEKFIAYLELLDKVISSSIEVLRIFVELMLIGDDSVIVGDSGVSKCRRDEAKAVPCLPVDIA